jgi:hypothetical protein
MPGDQAWHRRCYLICRACDVCESYAGLFCIVIVWAVLSVLTWVLVWGVCFRLCEL